MSIKKQIVEFLINKNDLRSAISEATILNIIFVGMVSFFLGMKNPMGIICNPLFIGLLILGLICAWDDRSLFYQISIISIGVIILTNFNLDTAILGLLFMCALSIGMIILYIFKKSRIIKEFLDKSITKKIIIAMLFVLLFMVFITTMNLFINNYNYPICFIEWFASIVMYYIMVYVYNKYKNKKV